MYQKKVLMAYDSYLAERINTILDQKSVYFTAKKMMGGLCYMIDDKMCLGIVKDHLMCRIAPEIYESCLEKEGCRPMDFTGRPMKGYVFIDPTALDLEEQLEYWIQLCLDFNPLAKASKKRIKKQDKPTF